MPANNNKFPVDDYFYPPVDDCSRLIVGCRRSDYSASRIARAVEDCDAHLLNLNVTSAGGSFHASAYDEADAADNPYPVLVDVRVNMRNATAISRSLERYGYTVLGCQTDADASDDISRERIDQLFKYLEI